MRDLETVSRRPIDGPQRKTGFTLIELLVVIAILASINTKMFAAMDFGRRPAASDEYILKKKMVGATGFEPATSWSQTKCSTRLSYAPA